MHRTRRFLRFLPLLILMLAPAEVFAAWGDRSPSQPGLRADDAQDLGLSSAEAKGGKGGKGGNDKGNGGKGGKGGDGGKDGKGGGKGGDGNGGNGGNGGKGGKGGGDEPRELTAGVQPDTWNTNWEHSEGTVSIVIRGGGLDQIDTGSIVLTGSDSEAEGLSPVRVQANKNQIRAFFAKSDAIALLDSPARGETHELTIELSAGEEAEARSLTVDVRIVGPGSGDDDDGDGEEDELEAEIQPGTWNTNWARSAGTVSVKITGDSLGDVDLDSIVLVGTDGEAEPLPALRAKRSGNHIRAFFSKRYAIETLDTPTAGETHDVIIRLTVSGEEADEEIELTDIVRVVGPGN